MHLSWLQAGFIHHTRQPNWWSVHQRHLATSCCPPFRQPHTSYKACVYGWQHQASSFKSSNHLPPKRSRDLCSLASHEPRFESHTTYLGHVRSSYTGSWTSFAKHLSVEAALHRKWQQLSQQDIRRLTGWMRRRVEALIQPHGGYTRYWAFNNRCRHVIHK
jgi:hypothetical protein